MNPTVQTGLKYIVVGGSVIMVAGAIGQVVTRPITATNWILPAITTLVGVSAFSYAMGGGEIRLMPKA